MPETKYIDHTITLYRSGKTIPSNVICFKIDPGFSRPEL